MTDSVAVAVLYVGLLWGLWRFEEWMAKYGKSSSDLIALVTWAVRLTSVFTAVYATVATPYLAAVINDSGATVLFFTGFAKIFLVFAVLLGCLAVGIVLHTAISSLDALRQVAERWRGGRGK